MINKVTNMANIKKHFAPHDLRRSGVTNACEAGWNKQFIQKILGNSDPKMISTYNCGNKALNYFDNSQKFDNQPDNIEQVKNAGVM